MALVMFIPLFLSTVAIVLAGRDEMVVRTTPQVIVGYRRAATGEIMRCAYDRPNECEVMYKSSNIILSTIVHGEYLYATSGWNTILRCLWYKKDSCEVFHETDSSIYSLVVSDGYLYAGLENKKIIRCEFGRPHSCIPVFESLGLIVSVSADDKYIYVANYKSFARCSQKETFICRHMLHLGYDIHVKRILKFDHRIITTESDVNIILFHTILEDVSTVVHKKALIPDSHYAVTAFNRKLYVLLTSNKILEYGEENNYTEFVHHEHASSISFAFGVHQLQDVHLVCSNQPRPSVVFNYREEHRRVMEATVVDGELRDSRGAAVDTRNADAGYSGRVAVFAMGPDGQLLLSTSHRSGLIHITSFFNGSPVSGAGEMIVEDGVIKKIIACSEYYSPDVKLSRQVVEALWMKGYIKADDIILEECTYTCDEE